MSESTMDLYQRQGFGGSLGSGSTWRTRTGGPARFNG